MPDIIADNTETRKGTNLPETVIDVAYSRSGLEAATGGDFVLTPLSVKEHPWPDVHRIPITDEQARLMRAHFNAGAWLVQRKSGGDALQSIPRLASIQKRMRTWVESSTACRLLITDVRVSTDGRMIGGGFKTDWTVESFEGALGWWEVRGGHWVVLDDDDEIALWVRSVLDKYIVPASLERVKETRDLSAYTDRPLQALRDAPDDWAWTGAAFPKGWGRKAREAVAESLRADGIEPTLMHALTRVLGGQVKIRGIGPTLTESLRAWAGETYLPRFSAIEPTEPIFAAARGVCDTLASLLSQRPPPLCPWCGQIWLRHKRGDTQEPPCPGYSLVYNLALYSRERDARLKALESQKDSADDDERDRALDHLRALLGARDVIVTNKEST